MPLFLCTALVTIKRLAVLSLVSVLFVSPATPQAESSVKDDNLYSMALFAGLAEMEKSWGDIDDSYGGRIRTNYRHVVVENDSETTYNLLSEVGNYHVEYLDNQALIARYKVKSKEFSVLKIYPVRNEGPRLGP